MGEVKSSRPPSTSQMPPAHHHCHSSSCHYCLFLPSPSTACRPSRRPHRCPLTATERPLPFHTSHTTSEASTKGFVRNFFLHSPFISFRHQATFQTGIVTQYWGIFRVRLRFFTPGVSLQARDNQPDTACPTLPQIFCRRHAASAFSTDGCRCRCLPLAHAMPAAWEGQGC